MADSDRWFAVLRAEYRRSFADRLERLTELARRRGAAEAVRRELLTAVHNLHGTSGSYGFERISAIAAEWEAALEREAGRPASHPTPDDAFLTALRDAAGALSPEAVPPAATSHAPTSEGGRILVVDDDPDMTAFISRLLIADGQRVEVAASAEAALARLDEFRPELIVADVSMPGIDGYALCREVRGRGYAQIPFFFCTVLSAKSLRLEGLRSGADDYLVKPIDPEEFRLRVRNQLSRLRRLRLRRRNGRRSVPGSLRGALSELDPATLLQILGVRGGAPHRLRVERGGERGEIYLDESGLRHAAVGKFTGPKALFRILEWQEGSFRLEPGAWNGEPSLGGGLDRWLLEGMWQIDEARRLRDRLRFATLYLAAEPPDEQAAAELGPLLPALREGRRPLDLLDESPLTDFEVLRLLDKLLERQILRSDAVR